MFALKSFHKFFNHQQDLSHCATKQIAGDKELQHESVIDKATIA